MIPESTQTGQIQQIPRFAKFEASFHLPEMSGNPFDPTENDVIVAFRGPRGRTERIPAFWDGDGVWKVRFAPRELGGYTLTITRNGSPAAPADLTSAQFVCIASARPGFVRVDHKRSQRFAFDNGSVYYPFGCNQAWASYGLLDYPETFRKMRDSGMNWARIWMCNWDTKALDWASNPEYSPPIGMLALDSARRMDMVFDEAERNGIQVQLALQHHGQFSKVVDPVWKGNPLNAANPGGFLAEPINFFTNARAITLTKAKYRYIVARWGYSDHLLAWELFNEVQNNPELRDNFHAVIKWHQEMAAYLRTLDINHHMVTTSYTHPGEPLREQINFDFDQPHAYIPDCIGLFGHYETSKLIKPLFYGEWGHSGDNWGNDSQSQAFLHDGIWSGTLSTMAGLPQFWYWDQIEQHNWWPEFHALSGFLTASGLINQTDLKRSNPHITAERQADVSFGLAADWKPTKTFLVTIDSKFATHTSLSDLPAFVQGVGHRDMMPHPLVFNLKCEQPTQFNAYVDIISKAGAHLQIFLDGKLAQERLYEPATADRYNIGERIPVDIPAGDHAVSLFNTGVDWVTINRITLTGYAPALAVVAKQNASSVYFWVYDRARPYNSAEHTASQPISGSLQFTGLADGKYRLTLWDTLAGKPLGGVEIFDVHKGALTIPIAGLTGDLAGWATRQEE